MAYVRPCPVLFTMSMTVWGNPTSASRCPCVSSISRCTTTFLTLLKPYQVLVWWSNPVSRPHRLTVFHSYILRVLPLCCWHLKDNQPQVASKPSRYSQNTLTGEAKSTLQSLSTKYDMIIASNEQGKVTVFTNKLIYIPMQTERITYYRINRIS